MSLQVFSTGLDNIGWFQWHDGPARRMVDVGQDVDEWSEVGVAVVAQAGVDNSRVGLSLTFYFASSLGNSGKMVGTSLHHIGRLEGHNSSAGWVVDEGLVDDRDVVAVAKVGVAQAGVDKGGGRPRPRASSFR